MRRGVRRRYLRRSRLHRIRRRAFRRRFRRYWRYRFRRKRGRRFVCHKFLYKIVLDTTKPFFEICPRLDYMPLAVELLHTYDRYRIKGINIRFRSDLRGGTLSLNQYNRCGVRLGICGLRYPTEFSNCTDMDCVRAKGFYREFMVHRDFALSRKTLWVDGSHLDAKRNPWTADTGKLHAAFLISFINMSDEFRKWCPRVGMLYVTCYVQYRDRRLTSSALTIGPQ
nr:MAG: capsid protein [Dicrocoelium circovirus]